jgi:GT2 family glycosyltransferase
VERYRDVKWTFSTQPLWYSGAVRRGLSISRYDWVYLLNSDMRLDRFALDSVLRWRSPAVFAVASQVFFPDPHKRREETGWTKFRMSDGLAAISDEVAPDDDTVRGTFYAGGGASLFRRYLLMELARASDVYLPFYWEDVEWGARAWRLGYHSVYCPASHAWHLHRMTNRLLYHEQEIDRILERNRTIFHLLNGPPVSSVGELLRILDRLDPKSASEILSARRMSQIIVSRFHSARLPVDHVPLDCTWEEQYGTVSPTCSPSLNKA